ncbi:MAG: endonuclease [Segetibacter sp.]|nr:endonuclease [Segetibacter sp.]
MKNTLTLIPHPDFFEKAELFLDKYELSCVVIGGDERYSKRNLKGYSFRTCRFCQGSYPDVTFSNYSHLLPQLIGNTNLYSDFECDDCNAMFSGYENDLAEYLAISRSIVGLQGQKKAASFTARKMKAKSRSFIGDNILILAPEDVKMDGNTTSISYIKNPYIPSKVYKAILKSALSLLGDDDIERNCRAARAYLMNTISMKDGAFITGYRLPFTINLPLHVFCFTKKNQDDRIPDHLICFNFQNHILSIPLPSDELAKPGDLNVVIPPPYFINQEIMKQSHPISFMHDLSSDIQVLDDEEIISFQMDPKDLENMSCYDPVTDTHAQRPFDRSGIKHIIITKEGVAVDPKELSKFITEQLEGN